MVVLTQPVIYCGDRVWVIRGTSWQTLFKYSVRRSLSVQYFLHSEGYRTGTMTAQWAALNSSISTMESALLQLFFHIQSQSLEFESQDELCSRLTTPLAGWVFTLISLSVKIDGAFYLIIFPVIFLTYCSSWLLLSRKWALEFLFERHLNSLYIGR